MAIALAANGAAGVGTIQEFLGDDMEERVALISPVAGLSGLSIREILSRR